jgi:cell division protein ZapA (FtsZ GTPase activity inhibitor)
MGTQAITVRIAGKSYPMTVETPQEEETIRKAERQIRERLKMINMPLQILGIY